MNNNLCFVNDDFIRYTHEQIPEKYIELLNVIFKNKVCIVGPKYLLQLNHTFLWFLRILTSDGVN